MWGKSHLSARRLRILLIVLRFEMGLKFEGSDRDKPGFLRSSAMRACLNFDGKVAWSKERFARWDMWMEKKTSTWFQQRCWNVVEWWEFVDIEFSIVQYCEVLAPFRTRLFNTSLKSNCVESVASWMSSNRLRLNPSKTELIWLGTSRRLQHCAGLTMSVCGADVRPVECVRDFGVLIDSNMTLLNHVNNVAGICFYQLRQLRIIRRSLTTEAAHSLVRALIHTRVDYCNGLLAAGPKYLHEKLQCVLRAATRLVLQLPHRASVSDIMRRQLHWLEMPDLIRFKLCMLVFRCLHGLAPRDLSHLCTPATVHTHLRSSVTLERSLLVTRTKTKTIGPRGFYFASSCCLERTSSAPARPWSLAEQFQN